MRIQSFSRGVHLVLIIFTVVYFLKACGDTEPETIAPAFCKIIFPHDKDLIELGTTVTIQVDTDDRHGDVASIYYYLNGSSVSCGSNTELNYSWNTASEDTGSYSIRVTVEYDEGNVAEDEISVDLISISRDVKPEVDFSSSLNYISIRDSVYFTDLSTNNPTTWYWDFGDESSSTLQNPAHVYESAGAYTVSLTAGNVYGSAMETKTGLINVSSVEQETGTLVDIDGNIYATVKIGEQWWMAENLRTTHYAGGTEIPLIESSDLWMELGLDAKAMCYYDNSIELSENLGALYTWAAAVNGEDMSATASTYVQGVCPSGWHIPSDEEWKELELCVGMPQWAVNGLGFRGTNQGSKLAGKAEFWEAGELKEDPFFGISGFNGVPGGGRNDSGAFLYLGQHSSTWSSTSYDEGSAWGRCLYNDYSEVRRSNNQKRWGLAVRCVKD